MLSVLLSLLVVPHLRAETITWENATTYSDGSAVADADKAKITTYLYYRPPNGQWTGFVTVPNGAQTWTGMLPAAILRGVVYEYNAANELNGMTGPMIATPATYTRPYLAPSSPKTIVIKP
jgi:hypothetical protein